MVALVLNRFVNFPRLFHGQRRVLHRRRQPEGHHQRRLGPGRWRPDLNRYTGNAYTNPGVLDENNLIAAFVSGLVNPFAINQAPGALDSVLGTAFVNYTSTNNTFDALLRGKPCSTCWQALVKRLAARAEFSRQNLTAVPDNNTANNLWIDSPTIVPFSANRTITSYYAEVEIPIVDKSHPLASPSPPRISAPPSSRSYSRRGGFVQGPEDRPEIPAVRRPADAARERRGVLHRPSALLPLRADHPGLLERAHLHRLQRHPVHPACRYQACPGSNPRLQPSTAAHLGRRTSRARPGLCPGLSVSAFDYFRHHSAQDRGGDRRVDDRPERREPGRFVPLLSANTSASSGARPARGRAGTRREQISSRPLASVHHEPAARDLSSVAIKGYDAAVTYVIPTSRFGRFEVDEALTVYDGFT